MMQHRPFVTVILAVSVDGKISDFRRSPARFGSNTDKAHLERQISASDAVLFGADTLRAYGTTLTITDLDLLRHRKEAGKDAQPLHLIITDLAKLDPEIRFFNQPVHRWLITSQQGANFWQNRSEFQRILIFESDCGQIDLTKVLSCLPNLGIERLAVLGGGDLVASMIKADLVDELWFTVCPLILGGIAAPSAVAGMGFLADVAPRLQLLEVNRVEDEVFLHYRIKERVDIF
ncbi:RibD family protein [Calothrix sp. PCC 6303]|uniref:RibD family protein n=1 Tax=Calothrix sp. PCC 6303 TaxID=1170562 RepID=UPI0002A04E2A|nr:RibD family protein [Calothrix sp. PCC 6303]AFZ04342.1 bifunctional deaminase-reductase domain protein [Calothrix sp. PCC 6303]